MALATPTAAQRKCSGSILPSEAISRSTPSDNRVRALSAFERLLLS